MTAPKLTKARRACLEALDGNDKGDWANWLGVSNSVVRACEAAGWIERGLCQRSGTERRCYAYKAWITDAGRAALRGDK